MLALLNEIRDHRVARYVGATSLTKLADYLRGFSNAVTRLRPQEPDTLLAGFRDWVYQRFQTTANLSWEAVILQHSATEADAVQRFWTLLDEYLQQRVQRENGVAASGLAVENAPACADGQAGS